MSVAASKPSARTTWCQRERNRTQSADGSTFTVEGLMSMTRSENRETWLRFAAYSAVR
jgi:hypothetical protein